MSSFAPVILLATVVLLVQSSPLPKSYGGSYGGAVPALPPFGVAAQHPRYGYGAYGSNYGNNDYVTALRYESTNRDSYGIQTSYAYDVDGQRVQVARIDPIHKSYY